MHSNREQTAKPSLSKAGRNQKGFGRWTALIALCLILIAVVLLVAIKGKVEPLLHRQSDYIDFGLITASFFHQSLEMVPIPAGTFLMTGPAWEFPHPNREVSYQREVTISRPFLMSRTEVTQGLWEKVMGDNPSRFGWCDQCPVEQVTWQDAVEFCNRLSIIEGLSTCYIIAGEYVGWKSCTGYRLPTEAEWEYAARAGSRETGSMWDRPIIEERQDRKPRKECEPGGYTLPTDCSPPNAWGLVGMFDNVFEWCWDWYDEMPSAAPIVDPEGPSEGPRHVFRGNGWSFFQTNCLPSHWVKSHHRLKNSDLGFRVVRLAP